MKASAASPPLRLFDRDRFRQISRLIDVGAHDHGGMVGQQLHRDRIDHRREGRRHVGQHDGDQGFDGRFRRPLGVVIRMILPPRAATSCMLETVFSNTRSYGAITTTGMFSSISAIGPCLSSPAA